MELPAYELQVMAVVVQVERRGSKTEVIRLAILRDRVKAVL